MKKTIIYQDQEFRKYEPEIVKDRHGTLIEMTLCEELSGGRWEPFYSTRNVKKRSRRVPKPSEPDRGVINSA